MHFINYIALIGKRTEITPLFIPDNIHHESLRWLCGLPHTIEHYIYGYGFYNVVINTGVSAGLKITFVYEDMYGDIIIDERFKAIHPGLKVIIDCTNEHTEIDNVSNFISVYPDDGQSVFFASRVFSGMHIPLVKTREQYLDFLDGFCQQNFPELIADKVKPHGLSLDLDSGMLFGPTNCNTLTLHAAVGDFAFKIAPVTDEARQTESSEAIIQHKTFSRQEELINQLYQFDKLESHFLTTTGISPWMISQRKSPLVISLPYNSSDIANFIKRVNVDENYKPIQQALKKVYTLGQTSNYTIDDSITKEINPTLYFSLIPQMLLVRSRFLDIVSSFHASHRFSPSLRLPLVGNDFNYYLSRVAPGVIHKLYNSRKKKSSLIQAFKEIGVRLSKRELSDNARNYLLTSSLKKRIFSN